MSAIEEAQRRADELVGQFLQIWLDQSAEDYGRPFDEFIDTAIQAAARGLGPADLAEESFERSHARHHGSAPEAPWGEQDDARSERAWTYDLHRPEEVVALLQARGIEVSAHGLT